MSKLTYSKQVRFSKIQANSLRVLEEHGVNISQFIRLAVAEKIKRDWKTIKEEKHETYCPF